MFLWAGINVWRTLGGILLSVGSSCSRKITANTNSFPHESSPVERQSEFVPGEQKQALVRERERPPPKSTPNLSIVTAPSAKFAKRSKSSGPSFAHSSIHPLYDEDEELHKSGRTGMKRMCQIFRDRDGGNSKQEKEGFDEFQSIALSGIIGIRSFWGRRGSTQEGPGRKIELAAFRVSWGQRGDCWPLN
ncbi:hypothetical protein CEXT_79021 [Caerostris extrusa]|uniref:Uncharacterized protein n=1 Tax=Caerostris extrusa TaxID=172846 RepID=A0AAV4PNR8_CAEEX|nr:hypothetical protein CEXT_79021 [Caerostris extrusa]